MRSVSGSLVTSVRAEGLIVVNGQQNALGVAVAYGSRDADAVGIGGFGAAEGAEVAHDADDGDLREVVEQRFVDGAPLGELGGDEAPD